MQSIIFLLNIKKGKTFEKLKMCRVRKRKVNSEEVEDGRKTHKSGKIKEDKVFVI